MDTLPHTDSGSMTRPGTDPLAGSRPRRRRPARICVTTRFSTPPERVFAAWLDPGGAGKWLFATARDPAERVEIDARAGGAFRFVERRGGSTVEHAGRYVEIRPPRRLVFDLADPNRPHVATRVIVDFTPLATGCRLTLTHEDVSPADAERTEGRWAGILYGLAELLEGSAARRRHAGFERHHRGDVGSTSAIDAAERKETRQ
jgi:uncharacterized protein YndB with AHSA1/START domain